MSARSWGLQTPKQMRENLTKILESMKLPPARRDIKKLNNLRWLQLNLCKSNPRHPEADIAVGLCTMLIREARKERSPDSAYKGTFD